MQGGAVGRGWVEQAAHGSGAGITVRSAPLPSLPCLSPNPSARLLSCPFPPAHTWVGGQRAARSGMGMELHYNPLPKPSQHCSKPRHLSAGRGSWLRPRRVPSPSASRSVGHPPGSTGSGGRGCKECSFKSNVVILAKN